jgi:hypothetical protein
VRDFPVAAKDVALTVAETKVEVAKGLLTDKMVVVYIIPLNRSK